MSIYSNYKHHFNESETFEHEEDGEAIQEWEDEFGDNLSKSEKQKMVRKKIEDMLEEKKLRHEIEDYEEEIFKEFKWKDNP